MKRKILLIFGIVALNAIAFTAFSPSLATPAAPASDYRWITIYSCFCDTGVIDTDGECDIGLCLWDPIGPLCLENIPCGDCLPPPNQGE